MSYLPYAGNTTIYPGGISPIAKDPRYQNTISPLKEDQLILREGKLRDRISTIKKRAGKTLNSTIKPGEATRLLELSQDDNTAFDESEALRLLDETRGTEYLEDYLDRHADKTFQTYETPETSRVLKGLQTKRKRENDHGKDARRKLNMTELEDIVEESEEDDLANSLSNISLDDINTNQVRRRKSSDYMMEGSEQNSDEQNSVRNLRSRGQVQPETWVQPFPLERKNKPNIDPAFTNWRR